MNRLEKSMKSINEIVLGIKESITFSNMEELIEALHIRLEIIDSEDDMLSGANAFYSVIGDNEYIFLSNRCPEHLAAFTLAHEVGHAILHDVELAHAQQLFKSGKIEVEANYFAQRLLDIHFDPFEDEGLSYEDLSAKYGIPIKMWNTY